ncbi:hypothetical protein P43SY_001622 [Pythium insidiosum]|uniref:Chromodomain-helicase-DNA-binding protein 1-like C-terminal domain-containing protein n=1 Tax=Pythium insidiosum TaxID=114742 RepID=A0AAD5LNW1_PYTIN|nr:hypothetical protein P43SY_001622 [Pythium insidiosum]
MSDDEARMGYGRTEDEDNAAASTQQSRENKTDNGGNSSSSDDDNNDDGDSSSSSSDSSSSSSDSDSDSDNEDQENADATLKSPTMGGSAGIGGGHGMAADRKYSIDSLSGSTASNGLSHRSDAAKEKAHAEPLNVNSTRAAARFREQAGAETGLMALGTKKRDRRKIMKPVSATTLGGGSSEHGVEPTSTEGRNDYYSSGRLEPKIEPKISDVKPDGRVVRSVLRSMLRYGDLTDVNIYRGDHYKSFADEFKLPNFVVRSSLQSTTKMSDEKLIKIACDIAEMAERAVEDKKDNMKYADVEFKPSQVIERLYENLKLRVAVQRALRDHDASREKGASAVYALVSRHYDASTLGIGRDFPAWTWAEKEHDWNSKKDAALLFGIHVHGFEKWKPSKRLKEIRQVLKKMKIMADWSKNQRDEVVVEKVYKYVTTIGEFIDKAVLESEHRGDDHEWDELCSALWTYAAEFTPFAPVIFERLYDDICADGDRLREEARTNRQELELKQQVAKALESQGVLGKIRAQLRAAVFQAVHGAASKGNEGLTARSSYSTIPGVNAVALFGGDGRLALEIVADLLEALELEHTLAGLREEAATEHAEEDEDLDSLAEEVASGSFEEESVAEETSTSRNRFDDVDSAAPLGQQERAASEDENDEEKEEDEEEEEDTVTRAQPPPVPTKLNDLPPLTTTSTRPVEKGEPEDDDEDAFDVEAEAERLRQLDAKLKAMESEDEGGVLQQLKASLAMELQPDEDEDEDDAGPDTHTTNGGSVGRKDESEGGDDDAYGSDFEEEVEEEEVQSDLSEDVESVSALSESEEIAAVRPRDIDAQLAKDQAVDSEDALNSYDYIEAVERL